MAACYFHEYKLVKIHSLAKRLLSGDRLMAETKNKWYLLGFDYRFSESACQRQKDNPKRLKPFQPFFFFGTHQNNFLISFISVAAQV